MNTIVILGNIITMLLIVKLESTGISPTERLYEFESLNIIRKKVIRECLPNYDPSEALKFLSQYLLIDEMEMYKFAEHVKKTGKPPDWSKTSQLKNYESYNFFRYKFHLEPHVLSVGQAETRVNYLRSWIFKNAPTLNTKKLIQSYYGRKVNDLMLFEDYYAFLILMSNKLILNGHNLESWRIKRAFYSLAIRDYNLNSILNHFLKTCFFRMLKTNTLIRSMKFGDFFQSSRFIFCTSKYHELNLNKYGNFNFNSSFFWVNYEVLITDSLQVVRLHDIVQINDDDDDDGDDEEVFVILPEVFFNQTSDVGFIDTNGKRNFYVKISTFPIYDRASWLTVLANSIEEYRQREKNYFNTHLTSHK